jgi:hypothetical protein
VSPRRANGTPPSKRVPAVNGSGSPVAKASPSSRARPPSLTVVDPTAGPEEAAAIVAALERFIRDTAPAPARPGDPAATEGWRITGLLEGVQREVRADLSDPWINT